MVKTNNHPDYILLGASLSLIILGILILASVSAPFSQARFGSTFYFLNRQLLFGLVPGIILGFLAFKIKLDSLKKWALVLFLINLIFLVMVFLPGIGLRAGGAARWLVWRNFSFQPSEFLKITFILYLAAWLTKRLSKEKEFSQTLIPFLIITGLISLFLVFQPDISTLGIIISIGFLMYFLSNTPFWHSLVIVLIGVLFLLVLIPLAPYRLDRLAVFLDPGIEPLGRGYQLKQALISIGSGGVWGRGLGMSDQKFGFLPGAISDSIFAIFAEETGFAGTVILISLFLIFFWQALKIGRRTTDNFSKLVAFGIGFWIICQAFLNISAMIGILPLAGVPLPFISQGGSHLIAELIGVGILLNISKQIKD